MVLVREISGRHAERGEACHRLSLGNGIDLLVAAFGGRIYGPFLSGVVDPIGWVSPAFASAPDFARLHGERRWNIGGERLWLSPELTYNVEDRDRFWQTMKVPGQLDPGAFQVRAIEGGLRLSQTIHLEGRGRDRRIGVERVVSPIADPPWRKIDGLTSAGYRQTIETWSDDPDTPVVPWIVRQVAPGGRVVIPVDAGSEAFAFFGTPPRRAMHETRGSLSLSIDADRMFKIGIPARQSYGCIAFLKREADFALLLYCQFDNDRHGIYHDEPPDRVGLNGFSSFVFQDDSSLGGYGELEFVGSDLGVDAIGQRRGRILQEVWIASGASEAVDFALLTAVQLQRDQKISPS